MSAGVFHDTSLAVSANGTGAGLAAASGVVTHLRQFSSLAFGPGSRGEGRRGAVGSLVAECEGAGDAEGEAMI